MLELERLLSVELLRKRAKRNIDKSLSSGIIYFHSEVDNIFVTNLLINPNKKKGPQGPKT